MKITEQFILLQAPNASAAANGRKLSQTGKFSAHGMDQEEKVYWAQCAGSGKKPYYTSIDFSVSETAPTCRCSCPSRQFPCKHAVGLMFEILAEKSFPVAEIPADLAQKREKQAARAAKKEAPASNSEKAKKSSDSARKKKLEKQLAGLDMARKLVDDLLTGGVARLAGTSAQSFEKIAKDLGNYYLTGPQNTFTRIALEVRRIQQAPDKADYSEALRLLIQLHATLKKARAFLTEKLEAEQFSAEDSVLYEALGGIWRLEDLKAIGAFRENARLIQLSFDVTLDEAKREYVERGFWLDLNSGVIDQTLNLRPLKALKYVRAEDSCFDIVEIPILCQYPGDQNRRIRWEGCTTHTPTSGELTRIPGLASSSVAEAVKTAKGIMKNTLSPKYLPVLLPVGQLGIIGDELVLQDRTGGRILLRDRREEGADHACTARLRTLHISTDDSCAIFGLIFYDARDRRICLHPYSVATPDGIIRLLF